MISLSILVMFRQSIVKIAISIPEKSSVAITLKGGKASKEHVSIEPATINLPPFFNQNGVRKVV